MMPLVVASGAAMEESSILRGLFASRASSEARLYQTLCERARPAPRPLSRGANNKRVAIHGVSFPLQFVAKDSIPLSMRQNPKRIERRAQNTAHTTFSPFHDHDPSICVPFLVRKASRAQFATANSRTRNQVRVYAPPWISTLYLLHVSGDAVIRIVVADFKEDSQMTGFRRSNHSPESGSATGARKGSASQRHHDGHTAQL